MSKEKLTRKQKKERLKEQKALEKQLVAEGKLSPRVKYVPRSILWNIFAVCLAFLFGAFAVIGGILGFGLYTAQKVPVKTVLEKAGVADYSKYVSEEYAEKSLLDLMSVISDDFSAGDPLSLSTFGKYSPFVKEQVQAVADIVADVGIELNVDELMTQAFSDLGTYFSNSVIPNVEIGAVLGLDATSDAMMISLFYGKEGTDYTVEDGKIAPIAGASETYPVTVNTLKNNATSVIMSMELGTVLGLDASSDSMMLSLCYGKEGTDYNVVDGKIVPVAGASETYPLTIETLKNDASSVIMDMELGTFLGLDGSSDPIMLSICYGTEGTDYTVEDGKILPVTGGKSPTTIDALVNGTGDLIGGLQVEAVLSVTADSNEAMRYLAYGTEGVHYEIVTEGDTKTVVMLPDPDDAAGGAYKKRTVNDLQSDTLVSDARIGDLITIDESSSLLMQKIADWKIGDLSDQNKIESLAIGDIITVDGTSSLLMQKIASWKISDLSDQDKIESIAIGDVVDTSGSDGLLSAISSWTLSDLTQQSRIERLKLSQVMTIDASSSAIMQAMKDWRIGDLTSQNKIDSLLLSDVLAIDETYPAILQSLKNTPIGKLGEKTNALRLCDILDEAELNGNKILCNLKESTLNTLSEDVKKLTVSDVFGDEIYSYMQGEKGSYAALLKNYGYGANPYKDNEANSSLRPVSIENPSVVEKRFVTIGSAETQVTFGSFVVQGGNYVAVPESDVRRQSETAEGVTTVSYYVETRKSVSPVYEWTSYDYALGQNVSLGGATVGDAAQAQAQGLTLVDLKRASDTYYTEESEQLYLLSPDGSGAGVYYPLFEDGYSVYYLSSGEEDNPVRTDLEKTVSSYEDSAGVPLSADAEIFRDAEGYYTLIRETVTQGYYVSGETVTAGTLYSAEETITRFYATWDGQTTETEVDRYLSGTWFLLFGGAEWNAETEELTLTDHTDSPVLNISQFMGQATNAINNLALWEMYFHGFLSENPFIDISAIHYASYTNLNQLKISDVINLVNHLMDLASS